MDIGTKIFMFGIVILVLFIGYQFSYIINETNNVYDYCKANGFAAYEISENKCYNKLPDDSGLGFYRVYSGEIDYREATVYGIKEVLE